MPAPSADWINESEDTVEAFLKASPDFMSPNASGAPAGATGTIVYVETDLPETKSILQHRLPHASVVYLSDSPVPADSSASVGDYAIEIGIRLYNRGADRRLTWRALKKAAAAVAKLVALEMSPEGTRMDGFAVSIDYDGGTAVDTVEESGYGAMQLVKVRVQIQRPDY